MGLIKAALSSVGGVLADQWKEYFYCDALDNDTLVVRGRKKNSSRSVNRGDDNIISSGSAIAVADGQCMMIVDQGKIVEFCAEPGEFVWDSSSEPSIFSGELGDSIAETFKSIGKRITYGGNAAKDMRVYYINTKEIVGNLFGTATPVMFHVVDSRIGLDVDVNLRCSGTYSYKITDPILFYTSVCANVTTEFSRDEIDHTMKQEFVSALQPALGELSELELRPNQLPKYMPDLEKAMNKALSEKWSKLRGISIVSIAMPNISLPDDDAELIKTAQKTAMYRDPTMAAATLTGAQADAMKAAASNANGAATGFYGLGMAQNAGGMNAQALYDMGSRNEPAPVKAEQTADTWKCSCGAVNSGKFCTECGEKRVTGWRCSCGTVNTGKFCSECGKKKPADEVKCAGCGWTVKKGEKVPRFCPECGKPFEI